MSFLDYFRPKKQPVEQPAITSPHKPKVTYGFMFKYHISYKNEDGKVNTYNWTSDIYRSHNEAQKDAFEVIEGITERINSAGNDDFVYIIDASFKKSAFLNATANDVTLLTFHDGKAVKATDIAVANGDNVIIPNNIDGNDVLEGNFKIMVESTNW